MPLLLEALLKLLEVGEEIVDELHLFGWSYVGEKLVDLIIRPGGKVPSHAVPSLLCARRDPSVELIDKPLAEPTSCSFPSGISIADK